MEIIQLNFAILAAIYWPFGYDPIPTFCSKHGQTCSGYVCRVMRDEIADAVG
ncbi:MAG TPA: hypothetical protein VNW73_10960 [Ktedonobacteraceae bacterium]|nr:hypothetical protein [Ktedonobacteraceae bacterium]